MGVSWTTEQQQVIDLRNRNILVSAAAGSGKTAVLVERIVKIITDKNHPVDIDHLLIVTFTNAAAAEMRERIGNAIEKALDEQPGNEHLLRQLTLIHNAQITTIDSFCLYAVSYTHLDVYKRQEQSLLQRRFLLPWVSVSAQPVRFCSPRSERTKMVREQP